MDQPTEFILQMASTQPELLHVIGVLPAEAIRKAGFMQTRQSSLSLHITVT